MITMEQLRAHLADRVPELRLVGTARDYTAASADTLVFPSAYVMPLAETSGRPIYQTCGAPLEQAVQFGFAVILYARDIGSRTGENALSEVESLRLQIIAAFGARRFDGMDDVCQPVRGRLLGGLKDQGALAWQDDFRVPFHRTIPYQEAP